MFNNVVAGVDEHQGGRDAVALASRLTGAAGKLTLVHVYPDHTAPAVRGYDDRRAAQISRSRGLLETAQQETGVEAQLGWTGSESVGRGLHEFVEAVNADLLVVGSTRRGILGRALIGDDTRRALDGAPCAVAIAPAGYARHATGIGTVGVAYDASPDSDRALVTARALTRELDATLAAMTVVWFPAYLFRAPVADDDTSLDGLVEDAYDRVASLGDLEPHAIYGEPVEELALWSDSLDLLVLGSRGYGPVGRVVHGSTSQELARRARCPLLVVPRAHGKASEPDGAIAGYKTAARAG